MIDNLSAQSASSADNKSFIGVHPCSSVVNPKTPWRGHWAITPHERLRLRCILDAVAANAYGLSYEDFAYILRDCDHPKEWLATRGNSANLDPKGFWRVDKDKDPWLRHTVLSLVAYKDLLAKGLDAFLEQNDGEGWMLPTNVGTGLNVGTGRDQSLQYHNVYDLMGPRFYDWQLEQDIAESWAECTMHAENIRGILGLSGNVETRGGTSSNNDNASPTPTTPNTTEHLFPEMLEDDLFGKVDDGGKKKGKRKR